MVEFPPYNFIHYFSSPKTQPREKHTRYFLLSTEPLQNHIRMPPSSHSESASDPAFDSLWWKRVIHDESFLSLLAFGFSTEINKMKLGDLKAYLIIWNVTAATLFPPLSPIKESERPKDFVTVVFHATGIQAALVWNIIVVLIHVICQMHNKHEVLSLLKKKVCRISAPIFNPKNHGKDKGACK